MRTMHFGRGGHYDDTGHWVQTKHCFVACGPALCDCQPPMGIHYNPFHDKRNRPIQETKKEENK